jgi:myo-inositol-1(or 4)-monophosphatase
MLGRQLQDRSRFTLGLDLARRAGSLILDGMGRTLQLTHKGAIDLVTEYDLGSEHLIIDGIRRMFPSDSILSEESGGSGDSEICWVIDPLDGTTNFAHGLPHFSVSIACWEKGQPQFGIIFDPARSELFHAVRGEGAWLNDRPLHVSAETRLAESMLATGFPYDLRSNPENNLDQFARMSHRALAIRRLGSAALDLAYVADGRFDGYWELSVFPWDWAAGILLVREAGGRATTLDGQDALPLGTTSILASNGLMHEETLQALGGRSNQAPGA